MIDSGNSNNFTGAFMPVAITLHILSANLVLGLITITLGVVK